MAKKEVEKQEKMTEEKMDLLDVLFDENNFDPIILEIGRASCRERV